MVEKIFSGKNKPIKSLYKTKEFTSEFISRCPHSFLLENEETFSVKTFKGNGKMFAPKVVGQAGDNTFNHFFGHLHKNKINRTNFQNRISRFAFVKRLLFLVMRDYFDLVNAAMCTLIWLVQIIIYPSFERMEKQNLISWHKY